MIHLEKINGENIWDILKLNVSDSQKNFVASNNISIIEEINIYFLYFITVNITILKCWHRSEYTQFV